MLLLPNKSVTRQAVAFSLIEVIIAIGVSATALITLVAVFGVGMSSTRETLDTDDMMRKLNAAEQWFDHESFGTVFTMLQTNGPAPNPLVGTGGGGAVAPPSPDAAGIYVYSYRGDASATARPDATLPPYTGPGVRPGQDFEIISVARDTSDPTQLGCLIADMAVAEGPVFKVVPQLSDANPVPDLTSLTAPAYDQAILAFRARVYQVRNPFAINSSTPEAPVNTMALRTEFNLARLR